jgi:two-component system alkaline phosphatase synthesis response regulator PhoP
MEAEVLAVGQLEVRPAEHCAWVGGTVLPLSLRELELLAALARRAGRIVPREELYETVWGRSLRPDDRSVDVYVHKLRVKLGEALPGWQYIHTHFGCGYRLEPTLSRSFHTTASRP